jgi:hypothetical protein
VPQYQPRSLQLSKYSTQFGVPQYFAPNEPTSAPGPAVLNHMRLLNLHIHSSRPLVAFTGQLMRLAWRNSRSQVHQRCWNSKSSRKNLPATMTPTISIRTL